MLLLWSVTAGARHDEFDKARDQASGHHWGEPAAGIVSFTLTRYIEAWSQPGAATGMINYYRSSVRQSQKTKVVVLESGDPDYFVPHVDLTKVAE